MTDIKTKVIIVKDICQVDTISVKNDKAWGLLGEEANTAIAEGYDNVLFDFNGIMLVKPWLNTVFSKFINDSRIELKLYNSDDVCQSLYAWGLLGQVEGLDKRIKNENNFVYTGLSTEEKMNMKKASELLKYMEQDESGNWVLPCNKKYGQLCSDSTIKLIEKVLIDFYEQNHVSDLILDIDGLALNKNIFKSLAEMYNNVEKKGIQLEIRTQDKEIKNKIELAICLYKKGTVTTADKLEIVNKYLVKGTVGIFQKFLENKKRDEFGRFGEGKALYCRIATFEGISQTSRNNAVLRFRTYNNDTFFTKQHWALENNFALEKLEYEDVEVPVEQVGLFDRFIGSVGHFMAPVQYKVEDSMIMYDVNNEGYIVQKTMTIPERAKEVFEDWDIEYDKEALNAAIERTSQILEEKKQEAKKAC